MRRRTTPRSTAWSTKSRAARSILARGGWADDERSSPTGPNWLPGHSRKSVATSSSFTCLTGERPDRASGGDGLLDFSRYRRSRVSGKRVPLRARRPWLVAGLHLAGQNQILTVVMDAEDPG